MMSAQPLRPFPRPRLWRYLAALPVVAALWVVAVEGWIHPSELMMASADPTRRLLWWLLPPILVLLAFFGGRWLYLSAQARGEDQRQAAEQAAAAKIETDETARAAAVLARQRETLEVLGLGLVVEKYRNAQAWEAIDKLKDQRHASILPTEAETISGPLVRKQRSGKRSGDTSEYAMRYFVEKVPLPGIVIFPKPTGKDPDLWESGSGTLMGQRGAFTLFITAEQIYADDPDEALGKIFDFFDAHPNVPAVYVYADDGYITRKWLRDPSPSDINGDPGWKPGDPTEAMAAFVLVRGDRVDKLIRPYAVNEKFGLDYEDKTSFVNRVWNFYFDQMETQKPAMIPTADEWVAAVPKLMAETKDVPVSSLLPFWERMPDGFKPSPWIPVPWTQWQLKEFDDLPTLGYLHRPQYATYRQADGTPLAERHRPAAFAAAWKNALATLPEGAAPGRLFFDAGGAATRGRGLVPMAQGFAQDPETPGSGLVNTPAAVDLSARADDTGAASPFVQIALAIIASYREGGVSATVNLRRPDGASILMVSPPSAPPEGRKPHPGAGQDPFKVPLMPESDPAAPATPAPLKPAAAADAVPYAAASVPLGTTRVSGTMCPQAGLWECTTPPAVGAKRRVFPQGVALPPVIVRGPERSLWQTLRGDPPHRLADTTWTLVDDNAFPGRTDEG